MAHSDRIVHGAVLQGKVEGVDEIINAVAKRGREVVDETPSSVFLRYDPES